jgi:hypothetical protein
MPHKKQGAITVDAAIARPVPVTAAAAAVRNERIEKTIPTTHTAPKQPYREPSAAPHPALKHLKQAKHVHEVF